MARTCTPLGVQTNESLIFLSTRVSDPWLIPVASLVRDVFGRDWMTGSVLMWESIDFATWIVDVTPWTAAATTYR